MFLKIWGVFSVVTGVLLMYYHNSIVHYLDSLKAAQIEKSKDITDRLFTLKELSVFNGIDSDLLYLSILGKVYDVTKGKQHYGPDSSYHVFIGRDASRSFITGEFSSTSADLDGILDLSYADLIGLENWSQMYEKQYTYKGKLIGRFYDENGVESEYMKLFYEKLKEGKQSKLAEEEVNKKLPPCNVEWDATLGSRVWCTKKSGGIDREWEGVPRMYFTPGSSEPRCVCVNLANDESERNSSFKEYNGCESMASSCFVDGKKNGEL